LAAHLAGPFLRPTEAKQPGSAHARTGALVGDAQVLEVLPTGHREVQPTPAHPPDKARRWKP
jgi:hypothetical protein